MKVNNQCISDLYIVIDHYVSLVHRLIVYLDIVLIYNVYFYPLHAQRCMYIVVN